MADLADLYLTVQGHIRAGRFRQVEEIIAEIDTVDAPPEVLVAILRYTASQREKIPNWHDFLDEVDFELTCRGMNTQQVLRGLGESDDR